MLGSMNVFKTEREEFGIYAERWWMDIRIVDRVKGVDIIILLLSLT